MLYNTSEGKTNILKYIITRSIIHSLETKKCYTDLTNVVEILRLTYEIIQCDCGTSVK